MLRSLFFGVMLFAFATPMQAYMVISDVDDTIKITNSGSQIGSTWNGLFKKSAFAGMPAAYRAWNATASNIYFVTGSPPAVGKNMHAMMRANGVPYRSITFRSNLGEDTIKYKTRAISRLMERHPAEQVVFIGDDVTVDSLVYKGLEAKYPGRVLATYIHQVKLRGFEAGQVPWFTAYDVGISEAVEGRVSAAGISEIITAVLNANRVKLFPKFAHCPESLAGTGVPTEQSTAVSARAVEAKIEGLCAP